MKNSLKKNLDCSSKFTRNNNLLDERYNIRMDRYDKAWLDLQTSMRDILDKYVDNDIIYRENMEEWLIQELIKDFRSR